MIEFAICDDDAVFAQMMRERLNGILIKISEGIEYNIHTFTSSKALLDHSAHNHINILFLDIDMPCVDGFAVAETLQKRSPDTMTVFVSAYDSFVYDSFQFSPMGFIRKEHLDDEILPLVKRVLNKYYESSEIMPLKTVDGEVVVRLKDICVIESVRNYFEVSLISNHVYKCRGSLHSLEDLLIKKDFFRIHKAYIVNLQNVSVVNTNRQIVLCNGKEITVSIKKWQSFKDAYMTYSRKRGMFV